MATTQQKKIAATLVQKNIDLIVGAFSLVAALAWNDAIQEFFRQVLGTASGLVAKFVYAIFLTMVIVVVSHRLQKISQHLVQESSDES